MDRIMGLLKADGLQEPLGVFMVVGFGGVLVLDGQILFSM